MWARVFTFGILLAVVPHGPANAEQVTDFTRDILVTFDNKHAGVANGGLAAPYRNRKRYSIGRGVRQDSAAIMAEHNLTEIEHWPIRALSVYCFVYRVPDGVERSSVIERLNADDRVESAQPLQRFETSVNAIVSYDDTYADLQYGLDVLDITAAHGAALGSGIRVAIIDSHADKDHEDLKGRISRVEVFSDHSKSADTEHGTAVASVIGARSNNALGIVGIAPEASLEIYVACWSDGESRPAVCDSFSLLKALDALLDDPPHVLNISLNGPHDPLLERLLLKTLDADVVIVAAGPDKAGSQHEFPASMGGVIGVASSEQNPSTKRTSNKMLFAPGERILVAVPVDKYDFRSGSSLAAAHVSGVVALLLSRAPEHSSDAIRNILHRSQGSDLKAHMSVNACTAINLASLSEPCAR